MARDGGRGRSWPLWSAAALLAALASVRLLDVLPSVANRYAFGWDSARRATLDMAAGDALRGAHVLSFLDHVAGPETWPTLRLVLAAPLHALAGPLRAFAVEHALSIVLLASVVLAVAWASRALCAGTGTGATLLAFALSTALLAGNRALLTHGADGMLEPLSAALTTGAVAAWIEARERGAARPWTVAVLGNLLFHAKWQHGILFALAAVALEWLDMPGWTARGEALRAAARALAAETRTRAGALLAVVTIVLAGAAALVSTTGGLSGRVLGVPISLRSAQGPVAIAALALFLLVCVAAWRRPAAPGAIPERLRFLGTWLVGPMAAWILVPFTWRLRTLLVTSGTYDSGAGLIGAWDRLAFYPASAWRTWTTPAIRPVLVALLAGSALAAWRSQPVRRRLAPVLAVVVVEWAVLTLGTRHNYQARFALNLAPLVTIAACAWIAALGRGALRVALAAPAVILAIVAAAPAWRTDALAAALAEGFDPAEHAVACRAVLEPMPVERARLVDEAPLSHRQGCALWAAVLARQRGARLAGTGAPGPDAAIVLTGADDRLPPIAGYRPGATEVRSGPLRTTLYVRER